LAAELFAELRPCVSIAAQAVMDVQRTEMQIEDGNEAGQTMQQNDRVDAAAERHHDTRAAGTRGFDYAANAAGDDSDEVLTHSGRQTKTYLKIPRVRDQPIWVQF
jgi:hypothetical protein